MASFPLNLLRTGQKAQILEEFGNSMVTTTTFPGGKIQFSTPSPGLLSRASSMLEKEVDTIRWIDTFEHGSVLWDVGANIGVFSLYASLRRGARVQAFEPHAANYHVLTRNIQQNGVGDRVAAYCVALAGQTGLGYLNMASPAMGAALNQFGPQGTSSPYWSPETRPESQGMVGFSADDFVRLFAPAFPNHVKIDVDGLELSILEGARAVLADARLRSVMVELNLNHEAARRRALSLLDTAGFRLASQGGVQAAGNDQFANHLFERAECSEHFRSPGLCVSPRHCATGQADVAEVGIGEKS
jgi:FkbM family methyltransferase